MASSKFYFLTIFDSMLYTCITLSLILFPSLLLFNADSTVVAYNLASHMKVCNDRKVAERWSNEPFHVLSINSGPGPAVQLPDAPPELADSKGRVDTPACRRLAYALNLGPELFADLISRVITVSTRINEDRPDKMSILREEDVEKLAESASVGSSHLPFNKKHGAQHASIVGNMDSFGLFSHPKDTTFIEFGAGKGYLTNALAELIPEANSLVMMDNQKFKLLADRRLREKKMQRIRCDIANFEPCGIAGFHKMPYWVAHGKHLCGAATDLTLRCCHMYSQGREQQSGGEDRQGGSIADGSSHEKIKSASIFLGLGIATCCHHRCSWQHYVAQDIILELGFSPEEFEVISYMTAWALCGHGASNSKTSRDRKSGKVENGVNHDNDSSEEIEMENLEEDEEISEKAEVDQGEEEHGVAGGDWRLHHTYSREERQVIGKQCKRLIDYGRVEWLRRNGFDAQEVLYCYPESSGENRLVLAKPNSPVPPPTSS
jgi:tRNA:m4X modification enzyme